MYIKGSYKLLIEYLKVLNKLPFLLVGFFLCFFILFNVSAFSVTGEQAQAIQNSIIFLGMFALSILVFVGIKNPQALRKEFDSSVGFISLASFIISFFILGIIFMSFEGRVDTMFMVGLFLQPTFLLNYMYIVAFLEEVIFRVGVIAYLFTITKNRFIVYTLASSIFALYHIYKYDFSFTLLLFSFFAGLILTLIKEADDYYGFPTFPIAVSLHLVYNLYAVGGLSVIFSMVGMGGVTL